MIALFAALSFLASTAATGAAWQLEAVGTAGPVRELIVIGGEPPVAMAAYYLKAVAPKWELSAIYRGMLDFMLLQMLGLAIVYAFPRIAL